MLEIGSLYDTRHAKGEVGYNPDIPIGVTPKGIAILNLKEKYNLKFYQSRDMKYSNFLKARYHFDYLTKRFYTLPTVPRSRLLIIHLHFRFDLRKKQLRAHRTIALINFPRFLSS